MSSESAILSIPISIDNLKAQMTSAHTLSQHLANLVKILGGPNAEGVAFIKAMSQTSDTSYELMEKKYQTTHYFFTRSSEYQGTDVYEILKKRQMTPIQILKGPVASPNLPNFQRKSLNDPGDPGPDPDQGPATNGTTPPLKEPVPYDWSYLFSGVKDPEPEIVNVSVTNPETVLNETSEFNTTILEENDFENPWFSGPVNPNLKYYDQTANGIDKRSVPSDPHSLHPKAHPNHPYPVIRALRQKRFVGAIIASMLTSIGIGSIFGAIDQTQISSIRENVNNVSKKTNLVFHEVQANSAAIMCNRNKVGGLEDISKMLVKFQTIQHFKENGMLLFMLMNEAYARVHSSLDEYISIVEAAQVHRFHPGTLSRQGAIDSFHEVTSLAKLKGLSPVIKTPQQMSQLETSFYFTASGITLLVEIPLTSDQTTFSLFRFNALPMKLADNVFLELIPDNEIIAIGEPESISGRPRYVELSLLDLSVCNKLGKIYICKDQQIVSKPNAHSCLYALFEGLQEDAQLACKVGLKGKKKDQVVAIGPDKFRYYSVNPSSYFLHCHNGSMIRGQQLSAITDITIPENCYAETSQFILHRLSDLDHHLAPKHYRWNLPFLSFLNTSSISNLGDAIKKIETLPGAPPITQATYREWERINKPFYANHYSNIILIIALLGLALGLTIVSTVLYKTCKQNRSARRQSNPIYKLSDLLGDESKMEALEQLLSDAHARGAN